jgi:hypothetical protein
VVRFPAARGKMRGMSGVAGERCETCYGEGSVPTDVGPETCPDCGGAGALPHHDTLVEWRLRELERVHAARGDEIARDIKWLAFELRRAREALTDLLTLSEDAAGEPSVLVRMRFVANRALGLYGVADHPGAQSSAPPAAPPAASRHDRSSE